MYTYFDQHRLGRWTVAIVAAYIIAVSTVLASFASARAAAEAIADPLAADSLGVICHTEDGRAPSAPDDRDSTRHCIDNCCVGCLALAAVLPPRTTLHIPAPLVLAAASFAAIVFVGRPALRAHRSRAPPPTA